MATDKPGSLMCSLKNTEDLLERLEAMSEHELSELDASLKNEPAPRDLLADICKTIVSSHTFDGFRYLKSRRSIIKKTEDLEFEIHFQSSRWNQRGLIASLSPSVSLQSARLKKWRENQDEPIRTNGYVAGGMLHHILSETVRRKFPDCEWDFAERTTRSMVVGDMAAFIEKYAIPYFHLFQKPEIVIGRLINDVRDNRGSTSVPGFDIGSAIEYTKCFGSQDQAKDVLARSYDLYDGLIEKVANELSAFSSNGLSVNYPLGAGYAAEIAWLKLKYDL